MYIWADVGMAGMYVCMYVVSDIKKFDRKDKKDHRDKIKHGMTLLLNALR